MLLQNYSFRYARPDTKVYYVSKPTFSKNNFCFYSCPIMLKNDSPHALVSFASEAYLRQYLKNAGINAVVNETTIQEFVDFSQLFRMPCVTVLSMSCPVDSTNLNDNIEYELFFKDFVSYKTNDVLGNILQAPNT